MPTTHENERFGDSPSHDLERGLDATRDSEMTPVMVGDPGTVNCEGEQRFQAGDLEGAIKQFEAALAMDSGYALTYNNLAVAHWAAGNRAEALRWLGDGLAIAPTDRDLVISGVQILTGLGMHQQALELSGSYLRLHPNDPKIVSLRNQLVVAVGDSKADHSAELDALRRQATGSCAAEADENRQGSRSRSLKLAEGESQFATGNIDAALDLFRESLAEDPDCVEAHNNLGVLYWHQGRSSDALEHLVRVLELNPAYRPAILNTATILVSIGRKTEARSLCEAYLARYPGDPEVGQCLAGIAAAPDVDRQDWLVSVIVSTDNAEDLLRARLEDLESQTIASRCEIIVVDCGSTQADQEIISEFQERYNNIRYLRTEYRESICRAWNRAVEVAHGRYVTIANTAYRPARNALEKLVAALDAQPDAGVVYADCAVSRTPNATLQQKGIIGRFRQPSFDRKRLFQVCYLGPQPMWRRALHEQYGLFDDAMASAGDYEFWLRVSDKTRFVHIPEVLGLYLQSTDSVEHRAPTFSAQEAEQARERYWHASDGPLPPVQDNCLESYVVDDVQIIPQNAPLVTVVIPTHNRPHDLRLALNSVVSQSYPNIEVVVVNDGGEDVEAVVAEYAGRCSIIYENLGTSRGTGGARNVGLRRARGQYLAFLDDDDLYHPCHLAALIAELEADPVLVAAYSDGLQVSVDCGGPERKVLGAAVVFSMDFDPDELLVCNYIPNLCLVARMDAVWKAGLFRESLEALEDWEWLARLSLIGQFRHLPMVTCEYFVRLGSVSRNSARSVEEVIKLYKYIYDLFQPWCTQKVLEEQAGFLLEIGEERDESRKDMPSGRTRRLKTVVAGANSTDVVGENAYQQWLKRRNLDVIDGELFAERMMLRWKAKPTFHLLMVLAQGQEQLLADTLDSLSAQLYSQWGLTVLAEFPAPAAAFKELPNLEWLEHSCGKFSPLAEINAAIDATAADWVAVLPPGVRFNPEWLICCADYINIRPDWRFIYTDSDSVDKEGNRASPMFRPDCNRDLLYSMFYMGEVNLVRRDALHLFGGFYGVLGFENYDAALKTIERFGKSAIGHIAEILYQLPSFVRRERAIPDAAVTVLSGHLARCGVDAEIQEGSLAGTHRVIYNHDRAPLVSVVIPTRDKVEFLEPCVESLLTKTGYLKFEVIIVDNDSSDPDTIDYVAGLMERHPDTVRVLSYPGQFNYAAISNFAAREAHGEYLLFLNNDTEIVQEEWLARMLMHGQRQEVGVVGARLVYPESGRIQHAGLILGMGNVVGHVFEGTAHFTDPCYMGRAQVDQELSAVTGACMLVRRSVYEEVGGMDEVSFGLLFNDVDLCLKVADRGYSVVWTPYATVVHHSQASLAGLFSEYATAAETAIRIDNESDNMLRKWGDRIAQDPAYNRNLSLVRTDGSVENQVVPNWDVNFHDRPRVLGLPVFGGSGEYRVIQPLRGLSHAGQAQTEVIVPVGVREARLPTITEILRAGPDAIVFQNSINDHDHNLLRKTKGCSDVLRVFALDDLLTKIPQKSSVYKQVMGAYRDGRRRLRESLSLCDRAIVTTEPLADVCSGMIGDIRIIPNYLERALWDKQEVVRRDRARPRVGWAGAQQHQGDLELIYEVVTATAQDVDWVFLGMCPDSLRQYVSEVHEFQLQFGRYVGTLATLDLDVAIAPLEINPFNEAKSNLRLLEYGYFGWPVVCTDITPYKGAPVARVRNRSTDWIDAILERVHDLDAARREGEALRSWVQAGWMLEDHLDIWLAALTSTDTSACRGVASNG